MAEETERTVGNEMSDDEIDLNIEDTFPASDPPSWTLGTNHREETTPEQDDGSPASDDEP